MQSKLELLLVIITKTFPSKDTILCSATNVDVQTAYWMSGFTKSKGRTAGRPPRWRIFSMLTYSTMSHGFHYWGHLSLGCPWVSPAWSVPSL
jgi:hypothetical protein